MSSAIRIVLRRTARMPSTSSRTPYRVAVLCMRALHILAELLRLARPAHRVHLERLRTTRRRNRVEARLDDRQLRAARRVRERERDERRRLRRVVDLGIDRVRMPAEGEETLRIHRLDPDRDHVLVALDPDAPAHLAAGLEWLRQLDAEPGVELLRSE